MPKTRIHPLEIRRLALLRSSYELGAASPHTEDETPSLLCRLLESLEEAGPGRLSVDDATGLFQLLPELRLPLRFRRHASWFCTLAKSTSEGMAACLRQKTTAYLRIQKTRSALCGMCRFGLTDVIFPIFLDGKFLGAVCSGSVIVKEKERSVSRRLHQECHKYGLKTEVYRQELARLRRVKQEDIGLLQKRAALVADFIVHSLRTSGLPLERLPGGLIPPDYASRVVMSPLARRAVAYLNLHYADVAGVVDVAQAMQCHPVHLNRLLKRDAGFTTGELIHRVRLSHALALLRLGRYSVKEVARRVGYVDLAHFCRRFKKRYGWTASTVERHKSSSGV